MKTVILKLTLKEAKALRFASGNILEACGSDEVLSFYGEQKMDRSAGLRAQVKLQNAIRKAESR